MQPIMIPLLGGFAIYFLLISVIFCYFSIIVVIDMLCYIQKLWSSVKPFGWFGICQGKSHPVLVHLLNTRSALLVLLCLMKKFLCKIASVTVDNVVKNFLALILQYQSIIPPKIVFILQNSLFTITIICITDQRRFPILQSLPKMLKEFFLPHY